MSGCSNIHDILSPVCEHGKETKKEQCYFCYMKEEIDEVKKRIIALERWLK